jgi:hypothetical protein
MPPARRSDQFRSPPALTVQLDVFARPVSVTLAGKFHQVAEAQPRVDLEQGFYGAESNQVWDVTLDDGQAFILVRSLGRGGWARVDQTPS